MSSAATLELPYGRPERYGRPHFDRPGKSPASAVLQVNVEDPWLAVEEALLNPWERQGILEAKMFPPIALQEV